MTNEERARQVAKPLWEVLTNGQWVTLILHITAALDEAEKRGMEKAAEYVKHHVYYAHAHDRPCADVILDEINADHFVIGPNDK